MKEERDVSVIPALSHREMGSASPSLMAGVSPAPQTPATSLSQQPFPTPSPFSFSIASTRWSSRPSIHYSNLFLRFLALLFSFVSALSLACAGSGSGSASSSKKKGGSLQPSTFTGYPELMYCFIVNILAFVYSCFQLFKGICDIAHRGILVSDMISDYISFILDQLVGYLLISSSSVAIPVIQDIQQTATIWRAAIISTSMSFVTFLTFVTCTLLSGYKLCKRIIW